MDALVIRDTEYKLPTDFTLDKWIQLHEVGDKDRLKLISEAFSVPIEEIEDMPEKTQELGVALVNALMFPAHIEPQTKNLIDYNDLTFGQFIDLEMYIGKGARETILDIANILYKNTIDKDTPISKVWGSFLSYMNYRRLLYTQYKTLFGGGGEKEETRDNNTDSTRTPAHIWYEITMMLADGKFLNIESVTERPVKEAFNWLAWNKNKIEKENQREREAQLKAKAQNYKR